MNIYVSGSLAYDRIMDFPGKFADHILPDLAGPPEILLSTWPYWMSNL